MSNLLYEKMYRGLDNLVNRTLNEKIQEIPDDEKRDNELIKSALNKMQKINNGNEEETITTDERRALERNGFAVTVIGNGLGVETKNGRISLPTFGSDWFIRNAYHDPEVNKKLPKEVNLVELGRKQGERHGGKYNDFGILISRRGKKKDRKSKMGDIDNYETRLRYFDERNSSSSRNMNKFNSYIGEIRSHEREADDAFTVAERYKKDVINEINRLKKRLKEIDTERDEKVAFASHRIDSIRNNLRGILDDKKKHLADIKKKKAQQNESLLLEKRQKISPEDERDNKLILSAIRKLQSYRDSDITDEERDALDRNGYEIRYNDFRSSNGIIDRNCYSPNNIDDVRFNDELHRINFADMGRKQKDRDYLRDRSTFIVRGKRKNDIRYRANTLDVERDNMNRQLHKNVGALRGLLNNRKGAQQVLNNIYDDKERDRAEILREIKRLKDRLSKLDSETEERANSQIGYIKATDSMVKDFMNNIKNEKQKG